MNKAPGDPENRRGADPGGGKTAASEEAATFAREAERPAPSFLAEFGQFLLHNKKWWLTPIIVIILLAGLLVILAGTVGPFIYPGL